MRLLSAVVIAVMSFITPLSADTSSYGRYESFLVEMLYKDGSPNNCWINFGQWEDNSTIYFMFDFNKESVALLLIDPSWDLDRGTKGSVVISSGSFESRYRIERASEHMVRVYIDDHERFIEAFTENYRMKIRTPSDSWPINLDGSSDAYRAWQRCFEDLLETADTGETNPWAGGDSSENPWQ